jgi:hypothetical protein
MLGGNPVITGPQGRRLSAALTQLDLFVSIDLFQRESHRDAHWLIPAVHWLERREFPLIGAALHCRPFAQYAERVVPPPPGVREDWEFLFLVAMVMGRSMYGVHWGDTAAATARLKDCLSSTVAGLVPRSCCVAHWPATAHWTGTAFARVRAAISMPSTSSVIRANGCVPRAAGSAPVHHNWARCCARPCMRPSAPIRGFRCG